MIFFYIVTLEVFALWVLILEFFPLTNIKIKVDLPQMHLLDTSINLSRSMIQLKEHPQVVKIKHTWDSWGSIICQCFIHMMSFIHSHARKSYFGQEMAVNSLPSLILIKFCVIEQNQGLYWTSFTDH